jgi:hypothetical protein
MCLQKMITKLSFYILLAASAGLTVAIEVLQALFVYIFMLKK